MFIISCNGNLMKFDFFPSTMRLYSVIFRCLNFFQKRRQKSAFFLEPFGLGRVLRQGNSATLLYAFDGRVSTTLPLCGNNSVELNLN